LVEVIVVGIRVRSEPLNGRERQVHGGDRPVVTKSGEEHACGTVGTCEYVEEGEKTRG
jgi:hypothetical protein